MSAKHLRKMLYKLSVLRDLPLAPHPIPLGTEKKPKPNKCYGRTHPPLAL